MFFAALCLWAITQGVGGYPAPMATLPGLAQMRAEVILVSADTCQDLFLQLLPQGLQP
ncbi:hypothetical protein GU926_18050 [Nibribacter ruber]|uniref:Uncharacterized protein n=1 Tax=Nibribacter ruber TaxID=2698458 RepID=A0A6P1P483_9BACT|nr:hypothetical protein [Nibribacter ruber]QHL89230.1 hypothetical protein GU926_18050 [Nibribacter ruber]